MTKIIKMTKIILPVLLFLGVFGIARALTIQEIIDYQTNPHGQVLGASTTGLVGYWNFDEGRGTVAADSSGNGNNGSLSGTSLPTWVGGITGQALHFDGSTSYVTATGTPQSLNFSGPFTVSVWEKADSKTGGLWVSKQSGAGNLASGFSLSSSCGDVCQAVFSLYQSDGTGVTAHTFLDSFVSAWNNIVGYYDGSSINICVNGICKTPLAANGFLSANSQILTIGKKSYINSGYWTGILDDVRIYNRSLSAQEILDIYNDTGEPPTGDTTAPSVPTNLLATPVSSSAINLSWTASTDNVGVTGYKIYRNGSQIGTSGGVSYSDTGLLASTSYTYTVSAYDAAGNQSALSSSVSAAIQAGFQQPTNGVYTVKPDGTGNFTTIQACANAAVAGETCDVYNGNYTGWTQPRSGSSGLLITFQAHAGEIPIITSQMVLDGRSYIRITGFTFTGVVNHGFVHGNGTTSHNQVDHNISNGSVFNIGSGLGNGGSDNILSYNTVIMPENSTTHDDNAFTVYGDRTLIEHNDVSHSSGDFADLGGTNVIVRNNYFHDVNGHADTTGALEHIDFVQVMGGGSPTLSFSLIENNIEKNCVNDAGNCHFAQVRAGYLGDGTVADTLIWRYNYETNLDGGYGGCGYHVDVNSSGGKYVTPNCTHYNNTIATGQKVSANGQCVAFDGGPGYSRNNICYNTTIGSAGWSPTYYAYGGDGNGNLSYTDGYSGGWHTPYASEPTYAALHNLNPLFADYPTSDVLSAGSPAINAGVALTTVAADDFGSGTSLVVDNARYFQAGWGPSDSPEGADWIAVGSTGNAAQIVSINYATNTITLASPLIRTVGAPAYLYKNSTGQQVLYGSAPDIGAYEYTGSAPPPSDTTPPAAPTGVAVN
jgi:chitodextrinase